MSRELSPSALSLTESLSSQRSLLQDCRHGGLRKPSHLCLLELGLLTLGVLLHRTFERSLASKRTPHPRIPALAHIVTEPWQNQSRSEASRGARAGPGPRRASWLQDRLKIGACPLLCKPSVGVGRWHSRIEPDYRHM